MKNNFTSILVAIFSTIPLTGIAQITPEAQSVIDAYNQATGSVELKKSIQSLVQTGTWETADQDLTGQMTIYFKQPDSFATVSEIPDVGTIRACVSDGQAWEDNSVTGFRKLQGTELQQAFKEAAIFPEIELEKLYSKISLLEDTDDGLHSLLLIDKDGSEETWHFDPVTNYLVEIRRTLNAGERGNYHIKVKMSDYKPVGDLVMPHSTETSTPAFRITTHLEKTEINSEIPEYIFKRPQGK